MESRTDRFERDVPTITGLIDERVALGGGGSTDIPLFNVEAYGAVGDGVTDDYQAIKAAWEAMLNSSLGGLLYFPRPVVYRVIATNRVLPTADKSYALFPMPYYSPEGPTKKTYGVLGVGNPYAVRAASSFGADGDAKQVYTSSILFVDYSTPYTWHNVNGHPSVFGFPDADVTGHTADNIVSNAHFHIEGITVRQPNNPSLACFNLEMASTSHIRSLRCDVNVVLDDVIEPTHPTGVALLGNKSNNNVAIPIEYFVSEGYYAGLPYTEHCDVKSAILLRNKIAVHNRRVCSHFGYMEMLKVEQCQYGLAGYDPTAAGPNSGIIPWIGGTVVIQFMDVEDYDYEGAIPWIYTPKKGAHFYAPNGGLSGSVRAYSRVNSAPPSSGLAPYGANDHFYIKGNADSGLGISGFGFYNLVGEAIPTNRRHLGTVPTDPPTSTPGVPTIGTATAGIESATVSFTPQNGGAAADTFTVVSSPASISATGSSSPIVVTGLTAGQAYTFKVKATNIVGDSALSASSNSVTPTSAVQLPSDSFNRANSATLGTADTGGTWTQDAGWAIVSNKAKNTASGYAYLDAALDVAVEADLIYDSLESGLIARATDNANLLYLDITHNNGTTASCNIYKRSGGTFTAIGDPAYVNTSIGATLNLRLECKGNNIKAYVNDVLLVTATDNTQTGTGAGLACLSGPNPTIFDNFVVTST